MFTDFSGDARAKAAGDQNPQPRSDQNRGSACACRVPDLERDGSRGKGGGLDLLFICVLVFFSSSPYATLA